MKFLSFAVLGLVLSASAFAGTAADIQCISKDTFTQITLNITGQSAIFKENTASGNSSQPWTELCTSVTDKPLAITTTRTGMDITGYVVCVDGDRGVIELSYDDRTLVLSQHQPMGADITYDCR